ncbi:hypothetical protein [Sphingomonas aurea]|nr:hypothetical protein [Sphingomonas sp. KR1UV-12]
MNLLLLLSALFSALAGIGGAVRAPDAVQAVAGSSVVQAASRAAPRSQATRPTATLPTLVEIAGRLQVSASTNPTAVAVPLWATRRRE